MPTEQGPQSLSDHLFSGEGGRERIKGLGFGAGLAAGEKGERHLSMGGCFGGIYCHCWVRKT